MTARTQFYSPRPLGEVELYKLAPSIFSTTAHSSRSDSFRPIPTIEAVRALAKENFLPFGASQARTRHPDRAPFVKHMLKFRKNEATGLSVGDNILEIVLTNGNDGTKAYHLDSGIFRIACLNGMVVKAKDHGSVTVRHTGMDTLQRVLEGTHEIVKHADRVLATPADWSSLILDEEVRRAFAKAAHALRFGKDQRVSAAQLLIPRRPADTGKDLWSTFNVLQEAIVEGGISAINARPSHRAWTTRRIGAVDANLRLNQQLWGLAESVAANRLEEVI